MIKSSFDLIIIALLAYFCYRGMKHGIIEEFGKLLALIGGIIIAAKHYLTGSDWVSHWVQLNEEVTQVVGFVVVFLLVYVCIQILAFILRKVVHTIMLGWLDRFAGLVFGFIKGAIVLSVVFWIISIFPEIKFIESIKTNSKTYSFVERFKNSLIDTFSLQDSLSDLKTTIRDFTIDRKLPDKSDLIPSND